jgi:hypothetical protein
VVSSPNIILASAAQAPGTNLTISIAPPSAELYGDDYYGVEPIQVDLPDDFYQEYSGEDYVPPKVDMQVRGGGGFEYSGSSHYQYL